MDALNLIKSFLTYLFLTAYIFMGLTSQISAQTAPPYNRFQFHNNKWKALHTPLFQLYFPVGYDSLASFASVQLPDIITEAKKATMTDVKGTPNIIIYPSLDQLYESNIGMHQQEVQTFPTINLKGDRVMVAFDGSFEHFREHIKKAWVRLLWEEQFKNDAEEQLTNKQLLIPNWFKEGCIDYFAKGWSIENEAALQHVLTRPVTQNFEALTQQQPSLAGQAFCYFLSEKYRQDATMQIFFQLRQGKSLSRGIRLVTKRRLDTLTSQCFTYYKNRNLQDNDNPNDTLQSFLEKAYKAQLFSMKFNADSSAACFIMQKNNRREVYVIPTKDLYNDKSDKRLKIKPFKHYLLPPWLNEHTNDVYPLQYFPEKGQSIVLIMPVKGKLKWLAFNENGVPNTDRIFYGVDGINASTQWNAGRWLLSAYRRGKSDIVSYDINTLRYTPLTKDNADHTELTLAKGNKSIIGYRSGYPADSLYHTDTLAKPYGIYLKTIDGNLKDVAQGKEPLVSKDFAYISWHMPDFTGESYTVIQTKNGYQLKETFNPSQLPLSNTSLSVAASPWLKDYLKDLKTKDSIKTLLAKANSGGPSFLQKVLHPEDEKHVAQLHEDSVRRAVAYTYKKVSPYVLQLYSAYFSAQVNNDYFINRYQPFQAYLGTFKFPEVGAMVQGGFSDLLENHQFNIGYRLPAGTEGSDFFTRYENDTKNTDWHLLFFRKVESLDPDPTRDWRDNKGNPYPAAAKVKTHYYELGFHTPLHYDWSLDYSLAARRDQTIFLSTDRYSLDYEDLLSWWGIGNIALKVHKLQPTIPLLERGWEGKILLDGMASTGKQSTMLMGVQINASISQPLVKDITLVVRAQGGYSAGPSKILYNFGGLDNNLVTRVDTSVHFAQDAPFAFQTLVTPFRGYEQNSIYGSRYGLLNVDVYFPVFKTLIPLQTSFTSLQNLQIGLFTDIAKTAGATGLPLKDDQLNSFGYSIRTMLAGYPIRFDMAWPGRFSKSPVWYLSLTLK
ncbi:hypothetical protein MTO98_09445 [Mucilaginibacter sp. SMC90]|uniref:hypothetical protein n=1 Tax=Mucilaginibacter sp. SMC90 TaxID=2929803 RepID=UPI001FB3B3C0|nr:hypothetical protein [Mucilaginibacter sp. SMC90]UOE51301.1 hypothetical protein MTO98_09445 [Mucilaginibacter sp. SMC90]